MIKLDEKQSIDMHNIDMNSEKNKLTSISHEE